MTHVLIIRGYCGAGKTTLASKYAKKHNCALLEYDRFLWNLNSYLWKKGPAKHITHKEYEITFKNYMDVLRNYLESGRDVVLEGILIHQSRNDPFHIENLVSEIKKTKSKYTIIQLRLDESISVERMKERGWVVKKKSWEHVKQEEQKELQPNEIVIDTTKKSKEEVLKEIEKEVRKTNLC